MSETRTDERAPPDDETTTHFGFRTVRELEKASLVKDVFDSVATKYDLMNDLMSLGVHRWWKAAMIDWLRPRPGMHLLDVGGGTGDIALRYKRRGGGQATIVDVNEEMLLIGRRRAAGGDRFQDVGWICGDAERLPIADGSVDAYTIAFAIRNVTRIPAALTEARRVLKPGGRFLCLEFSRVALPSLDQLYDAYSFQILPRLGRVITGNGDAYRYLVESIRRFPTQEVFAEMISGAGFDLVKVRNLSGGVAALHSAWRT